MLAGATAKNLIPRAGTPEEVAAGIISLRKILCDGDHLMSTVAGFTQRKTETMSQRRGLSLDA